MRSTAVALVGCALLALAPRVSSLAGRGESCKTRKGSYKDLSDSSDFCGDGLECHSKALVCATVPRMEGEVCGYGLGCASGLTCRWERPAIDNGPYTQRCLPLELPRLGRSCDVPGKSDCLWPDPTTGEAVVCAYDDDKNRSMCAAAPSRTQELGDDCVVDPSEGDEFPVGNCLPDLRCVQGKCVSNLALEGESCEDLKCAADLICYRFIDRPEWEGTCRPALLLGDACPCSADAACPATYEDYDQTCSEGYCISGICTRGSEVPRVLPIGNICASENPNVCVEDARCINNGWDWDGTCTPSPAQLGDRCPDRYPADEDYCAAGLACREQECIPIEELGGEGDECGRNEFCRDGLLCDGPRRSLVCTQRYLSPGDACPCNIGGPEANRKNLACERAGPIYEELRCAAAGDNAVYCRSGVCEEADRQAGQSCEVLPYDSRGAVQTNEWLWDSITLEGINRDTCAAGLRCSSHDLTCSHVPALEGESCSRADSILCSTGLTCTDPSGPGAANAGVCTAEAAGGGPPAGLEGDPHMVGFNGLRFEYDGRPGQVFDLVSTPDFQMRALIMPDLVHGMTYVGALGVTSSCGHTAVIRADAAESRLTLEVDDAVVDLREPERLTVGSLVLEAAGREAVRLTVAGLTALVEVHERVFLDIKDMAFTRGVPIDVTGVLGHTARAERADAQGLEHDEEHYYVDSLLGGDIRAAMRPRRMSADAVLPATQVAASMSH